MHVIPVLFRLDRAAGNRVIDEPFNKYAREILDGSDLWTPRRKWNGYAVYLNRAGSWQMRRVVRHTDRLPAEFAEVCRSRNISADGIPLKRYGWVPVSDAIHGLLRQALLVNAPELLPGNTYELCGPSIANNREELRQPRLIHHRTAEVDEQLTGRLLSYDFLRDYFDRELRAAGWEGIVWHGPEPFLLKLRRNDF